MASSRQRLLRTPIAKAWRDSTRTIQVLAELVRCWTEETEVPIHLDVVTFRNAQQLDARVAALIDVTIRELPKTTKLSRIARYFGIASGRAWFSGRLRNPNDLEQLFPAESIWVDDFALYSPTANKEISTLDALLDGGSDVEWYLLQITGSHDWIVGARDESRLNSMLAVAREVFRRHGAKLKIA